MELVIGQFIDHVKQDKNAAGNPDSQSKNIDDGIALLSPQISQGHKNIVL